MSIAANLLVRFIKVYRAHDGAKALMVECNFRPSCSSYAIEAIENFGACHGALLGVKRIWRCRERDQFGRIDDPVQERHVENGR